MITKAVLFKFIKFSIVGFTGVFVDFGTTYLFKNKLGFHKYFANSIGFLLATLNNYIFNRIWTFNNQSAEIFIQFQKFLLISLIGLLISNSIVYLLHEKFNVNFWVSKFGAISIVSLWNFIANYIYTFTK